MKEFIEREPQDEDACGFYPCDKHGNEMEPVIGNGWEDLYVCARCDRIIKQDTLEVAGMKDASKPA